MILVLSCYDIAYSCLLSVNFIIILEYWTWMFYLSLAFYIHILQVADQLNL